MQKSETTDDDDDDPDEMHLFESSQSGLPSQFLSLAPSPVRTGKGERRKGRGERTRGNLTATLSAKRFSIDRSSSSGSVIHLTRLNLTKSGGGGGGCVENLRQTRHGKERVLAEKRPTDSVKGYLQRKIYTNVGMIFMSLG